MRVLLLLALVVVIALVLVRLPGAWRSRLPPAGAYARDELVKDPVCQTYVVMSRAVRSEAADGPLFFCSRECAARFERGEKRV